MGVISSILRWNNPEKWGILAENGRKNGAGRLEFQLNKMGFVAENWVSARTQARLAFISWARQLREIQFSVVSPSTRLNSSTLSVTNVKPRRSAHPASIRS